MTKKKTAGQTEDTAAAAAAKTQLVSSIKRAKHEINTAESELEKAIGAIRALPRAEKVTASVVVGDAFEQLKLAQKKLGELEKLITKSSKDA